MKNIILLIFCFIPLLIMAQPKQQTNCNISLNVQEENVCITVDVNSEVENVKLINNDAVVMNIGKPRGSDKINIPIADMENGTYFIRVEVDGKIQVHRIIISK